MSRTRFARFHIARVVAIGVAQERTGVVDRVEDVAIVTDAKLRLFLEGADDVSDGAFSMADVGSGQLPPFG